MSVNGKFRDISRDDLMQEADRFGIPRPQRLLSNVREALDGWSEFADKAELKESSSDRVAQDFRLL
jgi:serine/threonine-protein kinase HipA